MLSIESSDIIRNPLRRFENCTVFPSTNLENTLNILYIDLAHYKFYIQHSNLISQKQKFHKTRTTYKK